MKAFIWLSFDLGVRGDYEGMYEFLDTHGAKECGDSLAGFNYEYTGDLIKHLTKAVKEAINADKRSRVYVIYYDRDDKKQKGRFIIGTRKAAPWVGRAQLNQEEEDVGE
jgi:hypothetical protein